MHRITLINGDGIGPEISQSVMSIIKASGLEIDWDIQTAGADVIEKEGTPLPKRVLDSVKENKVALKAPVTTPIGKGFRSVNVQLRKDLDLFANLRPCKNLPAVKTRFENVDLVVVRENTEDLYAGVEEQIDNDTANSIKIITRKASERICKFAFDYAVKNNRHEEPDEIEITDNTDLITWLEQKESNKIKIKIADNKEYLTKILVIKCSINKDGRNIVGEIQLQISSVL